jgi:very-short-patch-repair endonuclease
MQEKTFNELWAELRRKAELETEYEEAAGDLERRLIIRRYYTDALLDIMNLAKKDLGVRYCKYPFDWRFNKNEESLWGSIVRNPQMVMYPEFPVLDRFVDFGNPFLRTAIEADSKAFHDKEIDTERDRQLLDECWKTFRVSYEENMRTFRESGDISEMILDGHEIEALEELKNWMLNTSDGVVDAICFFYFMLPEERAQRMEKYPDYLPLAEETFKKHRYVDFELPNLF